jgi:tRNA pseudouridine55 synthase
MTQESEFIHTSIIKSLAADQSGVALIDKPTGWTSHDVVNKVRRLTGIKRVGHAGTLDPLATGLLIILIGREFTKMQDLFMKQPKEYLVTAQFGITTDSYDIDGETTDEAPPELVSGLTKEKIEDAMQPFIGNIDQQVPIFSAVKVKGKKLYEHGRKQRSSESTETENPVLPIKQVIVESFEVLNLDLPYAEFRVTCSSGTYIRSLIYDLGQMLGTGATVTQLRRTKIGEYSVSNAIQLLPNSTIS